MNDQDAGIDKDKLFFQHYLIVLLDILGQRSRLRNIRDLPNEEAEEADFIKSLKETVGKVDALRTAFQNYFATANTLKPDTSLVPAEYQQEFLACQKSEAYFYGFSDSIIIAVPLESNDENCTAINGVFSALVAASGIGLLALSAKMALRGGLDVGIATQINEREIYGPALERAYYLESNIAQYPRFAIGRKFIGYLNWVETLQTKSHAGQVSQIIAKFCREMIIIDTDGIPILDFMGKRAREAADNSIKPDLVKRAGDFVASQYEKYSTEENHELASRYYRLWHYFKSRSEFWE